MTGDKPTHCPRCISCGQVLAQREAEELCPKCQCSAVIEKAYIYNRARTLWHTTAGTYRALVDSHPVADIGLLVDAREAAWGALKACHALYVGLEFPDRTS